MNCIIQARMSSKRLPSKTMLIINGKPILERVIDRVKKSKKIRNIIVATSNLKIDLKIVNFCKNKKIKYYIGPHKDVALRFIKTIRKFPCKFFVRINADSPLIDPKIIDKLANKIDINKFDILTNTFPRTFPKGKSVEIINSQKFIKNYNYFNINDKEHITQYFYRNSNKFKIYNYKSKKNDSYKNLSVDSQKDFERVKNIILKR